MMKSCGKQPKAFDRSVRRAVNVLLLSTDFFHFSIMALREKCPNTEFFWYVFSCIWTQYGGLFRYSPCSVRIQENTDQKNSVFGQFSRSADMRQ